MLSDKEVEHVATLARIKISVKEKEQMRQVLSSVLDYINQLKEVDTASVEPFYQTVGLFNSLREDTSEKTHNQSEKLISSAPNYQDNLVKVRSVIDRNKK
jgi:aspartyl-tRNA(Asn)/glutamyl-tRNA(Gln) amidotransferase subunit C